MKVQCGQCPAKYAVSDDRIRGKKVRIHCKRCGASIVVDGKVEPPLVTSTPERRSVRPAATQTATTVPADERVPESQPAPRPIAHTIVGGLEAPATEHPERQGAPSEPHLSARPDAPWAALQAPRHQPEPHRGHTDPPPGVNDSRWRVALTKQDLRWMTTDEVVQAYRSGVVKLETFVFRSSMPTWVTLLEVPELADALADTGHDGDGRLAGRFPRDRRHPTPGPGEAPDEELLGSAEAPPAALPLDRPGAAPEPAPDTPEPGAWASAPAGPQGAVEPASNAAREGPRPSPQPAPGRQLAPEAPLAPSGVPSSVMAASPGPAPPPAPFALAQSSDGPGRWLVWAVVVLLLTGAAAALLGPSIGLELF